MKLTELQKKVKYVLGTNPEAQGSNTELYIAFLDTALKSRGLYPLMPEVKELMRQYPPEGVTRARRYIVKPTEKQKEEEQNYKNQYTVKNTV